MWKTMTERADIPHISQVYSGVLNMKGFVYPYSDIRDRKSYMDIMSHVMLCSDWSDKDIYK